MRFSEFYSRQNFETVAKLSWFRKNDWSGQIPAEDQDLYNAACKADAEDSALFDSHIDKIFVPAMIGWLEHLRAAGRLNKITGLNGRQATLPAAWNAFCANDIDSHLKTYLGQQFQTLLISSIITTDNRPRSARSEGSFVKGQHIIPSNAMIGAAFEKLVISVETGDTDYQLRFDNIYDSKTGDRLKLELKGWHATLLKLSTANQKYKFEPTQDVPEIEAQFVEIELPSGELLISDWIRVSGFEEATHLGYDDYHDISSEQGAINVTKSHASRHGFAHVQTTNTCVIAHQDESGRIMISERWDSETEDDLIVPGMVPVGTFSCDLWWITAIDRQTLLGLMQKGGCKQPEKILGDYLEGKSSYSDNIIRMQVTPGRWRLHFGPDFAERADLEALCIPKGPKPWLVLEPIRD